MPVFTRPPGASPGRATSDAAPRNEAAGPRPEHLARLLKLAHALSTVGEVAGVAAAAARQACALAGASRAAVLEFTEDGALTALAEARGRAALARLAAAAPRPAGPEYDAVRGGLPVWRAAGSRGPGGAGRLPGAPGARVLLPLGARGEPTGVLELELDDGERLDGPSRAYLTEFAALCSAALSRGRRLSLEQGRASAARRALEAGELRRQRSEARVEDRTRRYERERFARRRAEAQVVLAERSADGLERAQRLSAALSTAEGMREAVAVLVEHGTDAFGAAALLLVRPGAEGELVVAAFSGAPVRDRDPGGVPGGSSVEAEVLRSGAPLWLEAGEVARRFPESSRRLVACGAGSWLGVPVAGPAGVAAVLSIAFPRDRVFTTRDRAQLAWLAADCAAALSRSDARDGRRTRVGAAAGPPRAKAFMVEYEEAGDDGLEEHVLGVFSSEALARRAAWSLGATAAFVVRATLSAWTIDEPGPRSRLELDLSGG